MPAHDTAGFQVLVDGQEVVSVSNENLNILTLRICGDHIGPELAHLSVTGGYYGSDDHDSHLIWVDDLEITQTNEIEIQFRSDIATSRPGKTIEQLHPERIAIEREMPSDYSLEDDLEEIGRDLLGRPKIRERFVLTLRTDRDEPRSFTTKSSDYSFSLMTMWKWTKPDKASLWLTTTTIENIVSQLNGVSLVREEMKFDDKIVFHVGI